MPVLEQVPELDTDGDTTEDPNRTGLSLDVIERGQASTAGGDLQFERTTSGGEFPPYLSPRHSEFPWTRPGYLSPEESDIDDENRIGEPPKPTYLLYDPALMPVPFNTEERTEDLHPVADHQANDEGRATEGTRPVGASWADEADQQTEGAHPVGAKEHQQTEADRPVAAPLADEAEEDMPAEDKPA